MLENPDKRRWFVFAAAWLIIFATSVVATYSVFSKPITQMHGWTASQFTTAFSVYTLAMAAAAFLSGLIIERVGVRFLVLLGGLLFGLGWALMGMVDSLVTYYITFSLMAGSGAGIMYSHSLTCALRWFPDKAGKISGLLLSSAAVAPFILSPTNTYLIEHLGVTTTLVIIGAAFFTCVWTVGWVMKKTPDDYCPAGWTPPVPAEGAAAARDYTWTEMLGTLDFYLLVFTMTCATTAGTMMIASTSPIAQTQLGVSPTAAAFMVSISTFANLCGRLSFGVIYDALGGYRAMFLNIAITISSLVLMSFAHGYTFFAVCIFILGFAFGGSMVVFAPLSSTMFGKKHHSTNYAIVFFGYAGGTCVGPAISSYFGDNVGSYTSAYYLAAALSSLGMGAIYWLMRRRRATR